RAVELAPGVPTRLQAFATGGVLPYSYSFAPPEDAEGHTVGAGTIAPGAPAAEPGLPDVRYYAPPLTGAGVYRIRATVTDAVGGQTTDTIHLFVSGSATDRSADRMLNVILTEAALAS